MLRELGKENATFTPIHIRGKKRRKLDIKPTMPEVGLRRPGKPRSHTMNIRSRKPEGPSKIRLSPFELLPTEIIEQIFLASEEINLLRASPYLGRELSRRSILLQCSIGAIARYEFRAEGEYPIVQKQPIPFDSRLTWLFEQPIVTEAFFDEVMQKVEPLVRERLGKYIKYRLPFGFSRFLNFVAIPERWLSCPPSEAKQRMLGKLLNFGARVDARHTLNVEVARETWRQVAAAISCSHAAKSKDIIEHEGAIPTRYYMKRKSEWHKDYDYAAILMHPRIGGWPSAEDFLWVLQQNDCDVNFVRWVEFRRSIAIYSKFFDPAPANWPFHDPRAMAMLHARHPTQRSVEGS